MRRSGGKNEHDKKQEGESTAYHRSLHVFAGAGAGFL
jgi:hypothetical protein